MSNNNPTRIHLYGTLAFEDQSIPFARAKFMHAAIISLFFKHAYYDTSNTRLSQSIFPFHEFIVSFETSNLIQNRGMNSRNELLER